MGIRLLDKIKKLVNKADSAREIGSLSEAEAFLEKVSDMLEQHNLSMADIESHSVAGNSDNDITESGFDDGIEFGKIKSDGIWERQLFTAISDHYMCSAIYRRYGKRVMNKRGNGWDYTGTATIIGTAGNVEAVKFVYSYLRDILRSMSRKAHVARVNSFKERFSCKTSDKTEAGGFIWNRLMDDGSFDSATLFDLLDRPMVFSKSLGAFTVKSPESIKLIAYRESWIRSYLKGAVLSIQRTLRDMAAARSEDEAVYGLVVANKQKLDDYQNDKHPEVTARDTKATKVVADAYVKGMVEGQDVQIAKGVSAGAAGVRAITS